MDITILNKQYRPIAVVDTIESMIWTDKYQECGNFELYTQVTAELLSIFQEDYMLQIKNSDRTMIVESVQIKTNPETGNKLIVKGRSLESVLNRRIILHQTQIDTDIQSAVYNLINRAFINPEGTNGTQLGTYPWRVASDIIWVDNPDTRLDSIVVIGQYYAQYIYDTVKVFAEETDTGFKAVLNSDNKIEISLYMGEDRSYGQTVNPFVIFSPKFDNLVSSEYFRTKANFKSIALVFSYLYPDGALHINWASVPDWSTLYVGIESRETYMDLSYVDRNIQGTNTPIDTTIYNDQIRALGRRLLKEENSVVEIFDGKAESSVDFVYGTDFLLGDIVQIENEYGLTGIARITEITFSESPSGFFIYPTFAKI